MSQKITIEYSGGFCEPCADIQDTAKKIKQASVHQSSRNPKIIIGGAVQSQTNPASWSINFYEKNYANEKCFIACVMCGHNDVQKIINAL